MRNEHVFKAAIEILFSHGLFHTTICGGFFGILLSDSHYCLQGTMLLQMQRFLIYRSTFDVTSISTMRSLQSLGNSNGQNPFGHSENKNGLKNTLKIACFQNTYYVCVCALGKFPHRVRDMFDE